MNARTFEFTYNRPLLRRLVAELIEADSFEKGHIVRLARYAIRGSLKTD